MINGSPEVLDETPPPAEHTPSTPYKPAPPAPYHPSPYIPPPPPPQYAPTQGPYIPAHKLTPHRYGYTPAPHPYSPPHSPAYSPSSYPYPPLDLGYGYTPAPGYAAPHHPNPASYHQSPPQYHPTPAPYHPTPAPYHPTPAPYHPTPAAYHPNPAPYHPSPAPFHHAPAKHNPQYDGPPACSKNTTKSWCLEDPEYPSHDIAHAIEYNYVGVATLYKDVLANTENSVDRLVELPQETYLCPSRTEYMMPLRAQDSEGKWRIIVNGVKAHYETLTQTGRVEECETAGSSCPLVPDCYPTKCVQKSIYHR